MNGNQSYLMMPAVHGGRLLLLAAASLSFALHAGAAGSLQQASVTEAVNTVSYQANASAPQQAAAIGTTIHPDNIVRTGVKSRAELQFNDNTVTRIGANSIFSFDAQSQTINLQQGTALFSKPKDSNTFEIATPAATCSISGTTGFLEVLPATDHAKASFVIGLIEGHTTIEIGGKNYSVGSGDLLVRNSDGQVRLLSFNIPQLLNKAGLFKSFKSKLPNQVYIDKALKKFASLEKRGFIEKTPFSLDSNDKDFRFRGQLVGNFNEFGKLIDDLNRNRQIQSIQAIQDALSHGSHGQGGFDNIGGVGIIRGQLVWNVYADLDLHLILPGSAGELFYGSPRDVNDHPSITFNGGNATATLDHDNTGPIIDVPPTSRVENIAITGTPATGNYQFYVNDFSSSGPVNYTLTVTGNNGATTQTQTGILSGTGASGAVITVSH